MSALDLAGSGPAGPRIAWVTPLARGTGVARYSVSVARALSALADVDVFAPMTGNDFGVAEAGKVVAIGDGGVPAEAVRELLLGYDAVFYNLGNNADFHSEVYDCYLSVPGVVVLHDKVMQGFFSTYSVRRGWGPSYYVDLMTYVYGDEGRSIAREVMGKGWNRDLELRAASVTPLVEPCLFNALGAVVHSADTAEIVSVRYGDLLPVAALELPAFVRDFDYPGQPLLSRAELGLAPDAVVVTAAGRMVPPKRLDVLIRAVAGDVDLKGRVVIVLAGGGDTEFVEGLRRVAAEAGISDRVRFVLDPDDRTMHSHIAAADICVNLRNPSTESASAALVEQLRFGKPVLVSRVGIYDELPDDVVVKTDIADEEASVRKGLGLLVTDEDYRSRVADAAAAYARAHHDPVVYAAALVEFVRSLPSVSARLATVDRTALSLGPEWTAETLESCADERARVLARELSSSPSAPSDAAAGVV